MAMNSSVSEKILREGENCWKAFTVNRAAVLIDGQDCFRAMREAMIKARKAIFIIGWDIHSELKMVRDEPSDGYPEMLGDFLSALIKEHAELNVYILDWDFVMVYAMEREMFPYLKLMWKAFERLYFKLDGEHPIGGSQHQKIVVIDDEIAFTGGLDLSHCRWDTQLHLVDDSRRISPDGTSYPPFHDVHLVVDGEAAAALGMLARTRWRRAEQPLDLPDRIESDGLDKWPDSIKPLFNNVKIGIARTFPAYRDYSAVKEVETLYLDSIAAARKFIYIENQYFTAHSVGEALAEKLQQKNGPEIVVVLPESSNGWLEHYVMDVLRFRLIRKLKKADRYGRLRLYYVQLDKEQHLSLMVHAKVMVVDDIFLRIASSNLNNRSMGLDSECDVAIEATSENDCRENIRELRQRLIAEHLGVEAEKVQATEKSQSTLIKAIESLNVDKNSFRHIDQYISPELDKIVPDSYMIDPEKPVEPDELIKYLFGYDKPNKIRRRWFRFGVFLFVLAIVAAVLVKMRDWIRR